MDLSRFDNEKIQGYAIVLKFVAGTNFLCYQKFRIKNSGMEKRHLKVRLRLRNFGFQSPPPVTDQQRKRSSNESVVTLGNR